MKRILSLIVLPLFLFQPAKAEGVAVKDTIMSFNLDEVVVTSSPKETNDFKRLPAAASIITPQSISGRQINAIKDITAFVPNLHIPNYGSRMTSAIYIRGIGTRASGQSVGMYVDDMPYFDKSTFDFELSDIQRIEVLRGPQGTLYGRNAMGGILNIYTLSPMDYQGTRLFLSGGNYGLFKAKVSHYNKLSKNVGLSASAYYDRNDGFFTNEYTGKKADNEEAVGGRLKLEWLATPNLSFAYTLSADYNDQGAFPYRIYDKGNDVLHPVNINRQSSYTRTMFANNLRMEYRAENFLLTSTTGHQFLDDNMFLDQDFSALDTFYMAQMQKQNVLSEEIVIKSRTNSNYQWSFGAYGFYNNAKVEAPVTFAQDGVTGTLQRVFDNLKDAFPQMPALTILDTELLIPGDFEVPSYGAALFHQSTYNNLFVDGLSLTAGIRLDYEKQEMDYRSSAMMNLGMSFNPNMPPTPVPGIEPSVVDEHLTQDYWQLLPKIGLLYRLSDQTSAYLSVAKGYKAGGYNIQMSADIMQSRMQYDLMSRFAPQQAVEPVSIKDAMSYKPEQSWNYEVGFRGELIKNVLQAEAALFYMDIQDVQITQYVSSGNGRVLANLGVAESYGVEVSLRANILTGLTADMNYGYTHATFTDYDDGKNDYKGKVIPYTPNHTFSGGLNYNKLFRNSFFDQFMASAQYIGAGKIFWDEANTDSQSFTGTVNVKAGVRKGNVKIDVWSRNLTNEDYTVFSFISQNSIHYRQQCRPLQFGIDLSYAF